MRRRVHPGVPPVVELCRELPLPRLGPPPYRCARQAPPILSGPAAPGGRRLALHLAQSARPWFHVNTAATSCVSRETSRPQRCVRRRSASEPRSRLNYTRPPVEAPGPVRTHRRPARATARSETTEVRRQRMRSRDLPRVMAVANQKGGVGKTTTAVNLGACLADLGFRVLVVDLDPQGNATHRARDQTGTSRRRCTTCCSTKCRSRTASSRRRCGTCSWRRPTSTWPAPRSSWCRRSAVSSGSSGRSSAVRDDYDYVLIDCPPSLGLLTVNGLAAASEVLVPIQCEYYALEGLGQLLRNVDAGARRTSTRRSRSPRSCW